jgi:sulfite reductase (NADPH) flavoprotein alpha-component
MPLADRMKLADGRALPRRMMAAMGQQDCGQCGYNCADYASAIFSKKEERLNLCVPGGKETARMLKTLHQELDGAASSPTASTESVAPEKPAAQTTAAARAREKPVDAVFLSRTRLNKRGSEKETWHIEIDISGCGLEYRVGDSLGVFPKNPPALVEAVIAALHVPADFPIGGRTLREELTDSVSLGLAPDMLFTLFSYLTGGERRQKAKALAAGEDAEADTLDVLAAIEMFSGVRPDPEAFIEALDPLQPRLYSIASSPKVDPTRVGLCIDAVRYPINGRTRLGVASTFFADRIRDGERIKAYVQKAKHFRLPADPNLPIIMIGPGTGIAPFRAFLHERMATKAPGRNWLFFGHQRRNCDSGACRYRRLCSPAPTRLSSSRRSGASIVAPVGFSPAGEIGDPAAHHRHRRHRRGRALFDGTLVPGFPPTAGRRHRALATARFALGPEPKPLVEPHEMRRSTT